MAPANVIELQSQERPATERGENPRVFLIRHAHAEEGEKDPRLGRHLTELGRRQAEALARRMARWQLDAIVTSGMHRAYETACAIRVHHPGVPCHVDAMFQEVSRTAIEDELEAGDGTLTKRLEAIWERIVHLTDPVTAIVTHGGLIKYVIGRAIRHEGRLKPRFHSAHTGITALEVKPGRGAQVVFFNDARHLTPEIAAGPKRPWIEDPATGRWVFR